MAGIHVGSGHSSKKSVDAEIPLVPFIDLLLCCVMFLLVTAVWNQLAGLDAQQNTPGASAADRVASERIQLQIALSAQGYVLSSSAGDSVQIGRDVAELGAQLEKFRVAYPQNHSITVIADDGIAFESVVATMDAAKSRGFASITL